MCVHDMVLYKSTFTCTLPEQDPSLLLIVLVLISFSHGYSAILAAKLMIKLDLT